MGASDEAIRASPPILPVPFVRFQLAYHQQQCGCPKRTSYLNENMF